MTSRDPKEQNLEVERRQEDSKMRAEVMKTLGSVQTAISLFEKTIDQTREEFDSRLDALTEKIETHEEDLNGSSTSEGFHFRLRQIERSVSALLQGVLGLEGANYDKSIKGQLDFLRREISAVDKQVASYAIKLESIDQGKRDRVTLRGQNLVVVASLCTVTGAILAASINAFGPRLWHSAGRAWEHIKNPPPVEIPSGKASPVPDWIKPRRRGTRKHPRAVIVKPALDPEAPTSIVDPAQAPNQ